MTALNSALENTHVAYLRNLPSPNDLFDEVSIETQVQSQIVEFRRTIGNILSGADKRLMVIVGPCSISEPKSALEYANRLKVLSDSLSDRLFIVMRVYFQKPRTIRGWKGFVYDPDLDGSHDIVRGLKLSRRLMADIANLGLAIGTEFLDSIVPQYLSDLVTWTSIGARTSESQIHRELASGLSMPVGFKNNTSGNIDVAVHAAVAGMGSHVFLGIDKAGVPSVVKTTGNPDCHLILRGGNQSNYDTESVKSAVKLMAEYKIEKSLIIDCSHGNSNKDCKQQVGVANAVMGIRKQIPGAVGGLMLESNLFEGKQSIPEKVSDLKYGVSITDECLGWEDSEKCLRHLYDLAGG